MTDEQNEIVDLLGDATVYAVEGGRPAAVVERCRRVLDLLAPPEQARTLLVAELEGVALKVAASLHDEPATQATRAHEALRALDALQDRAARIDRAALLLERYEKLLGRWLAEDAREQVPLRLMVEEIISPTRELLA